MNMLSMSLFFFSVIGAFALAVQRACPRTSVPCRPQMRPLGVTWNV